MGQFAIRAKAIAISGFAAIVTAIIGIAPVWGTESANPSVPAGIYSYTVSHGRLGKIGDYTNVISHDGDRTIVETEVDITAKVLFLRVAREKAQRRQIWRDGRLIDYHSETGSGKDKAVTTGRAEGGKFLIEGPRGKVTAPAGVFPINPWNPDIIEAEVLMGEKNGTLHPVKRVESGEETITWNGDSIPTLHYKLIGHRDEEIWFDARGVAVKFSARYKGDAIIFTLNAPDP